MYSRLLNILIAGQDPLLEKLLQEVTPQERFTHTFFSYKDIQTVRLEDYAVIVLDFATMTPLPLATLTPLLTSRNRQSRLIGCFSSTTISLLHQTSHLFDTIWCKPLHPATLHNSFTLTLEYLKEKEDAVLNQAYLDTLINSLPDLIWFKDTQGAHLKVNDTFCRTVNKSKEQIQGRGHYYIWDIEPDEYAQGEYVCLESEEIVLHKKETCLFDETVKCGNENRKFKTYKSPIFDRNGQVMGTAGCAHDVTDLQNLMIELNILLESLPFAIVVTDKEKKITTVNQKFIDIFFLTRTELIGQYVDSFFDESKTFTKNRRWVIDEEGTLFLSQDKILKLHEEKLLDIFGVLAGYIHIFADITLEYHSKNRLLIDANTDHLTTLNNRRSLQDFMRKTPCTSNTALLLADLDNFKEVNDQFGHKEGDAILVAFADLLKQMFPIRNLFRLGGDEFAILIHGMKDTSIPKEYGKQLLARFKTDVSEKFPHTRVSLSIGIAMDVANGDDFGELFKKADMALYESKNSGKSAATFWKR